MTKICEGAEECKTGERSLPVEVGIQLCSEGGDTVARVTPVLVHFGSGQGLLAPVPLGVFRYRFKVWVGLTKRMV